MALRFFVLIWAAERQGHEMVLVWSSFHLLVAGFTQKENCGSQDFPLQDCREKVNSTFAFFHNCCVNKKIKTWWCGPRTPACCWPPRLGQCCGRPPGAARHYQAAASAHPPPTHGGTWILPILYIGIYNSISVEEPTFFGWSRSRSKGGAPALTLSPPIQNLTTTKLVNHWI